MRIPISIRRTFASISKRSDGRETTRRSGDLAISVRPVATHARDGKRAEVGAALTNLIPCKPTHGAHWDTPAWQRRQCHCFNISPSCIVLRDQRGQTAYCGTAEGTRRIRWTRTHYLANLFAATRQDVRQLRGYMTVRLLHARLQKQCSNSMLRSDVRACELSATNGT